MTSSRLPFARTLAFAAVLSVSTGFASNASARPFAAQRKAALQHGAAYVRSTLVEGPKHTIHAITTKPVRFTGMVLGVAVMGGALHAAGVDPTIPALALSGGSLALSTWRSVPSVRASRGLERARIIGRDIVWPTMLAGLSTVAGLLVGHGSGSAAHATGAGEVARAGAEAALIGGDGPMIIQTAFDTPAKPAKHH